MNEAYGGNIFYFTAGLQRILKEIPRLTGQAGQVQGAGIKWIPNQSEPHSAFPFSMVRISTLLLGAFMAVLIPDNTNALCCSYRGRGWGEEGACTSHNGHTCNIFCCNCGGGRPGTSKCFPVSTLSFINLISVIKMEIISSTTGHRQEEEVCARVWCCTLGDS